jgi:hypothetical protein
MRIKQQKLQDVLHDIKAKYDLATRNKADFQSRITTTQDAKKMLERALKQKLEEIKHKCAELRRICSGFNLAQELHALIDQLKAEATMLRNIEAKQQAEEFIRSLSEFCRQLEADQLSKQVLPPMRLVDTYTSKPFRSSTSSTPIPPPSLTSSSENTPNLNTSVLDLITRLNKTKKPLPSVHGGDEDDDEENSENDEDDDSPRERPPTSLRSNRGFNPANNDNYHDDETDRRRRRQSAPNNNNNNNTNNTNTLQQQYASITTAELVQRYTDCKDARKSNAILTELSRRSQGKSTGPLVSPTDISTFARYTQLYGSQDAPTLSHLYLQLQQRISNMTEPDILNIARVPGDLLLEIAALYTLVAQKNQQQQQQGQGNESAFERPPDHIASSMMMKMSTPISQTPIGFYSTPVNQHPGGATTPTTNTFFKPIQPTSMSNPNVQPNPIQTSLFSIPTSSPPQPPPPTPLSPTQQPPPPPTPPQQQQQQQQPQQQTPLSFVGFTGTNIISPT